MKKIKSLKRSCILCLLCFSLSTASQMAVPVLAAMPEPTVQPMADDIRWRYKNSKGKLYKRLYNYTKRTWIGDWIPA